jgi:diguanylate cyclase (GGDEF)-like protein
MSEEAANNNPDRSRRATGVTPASQFEDVLVGGARSKRLLDYVFFQASEQVNQEQAQCLARIAITTVVTVLLIVHALFFEGARDIPFIGVAYGVASWLHYRLVSRYRDQFLWRRYLTMAADLAMGGYLIFRIGHSGLAVYPLFLWVIIGNGLRFGSHYLRVATVVGFLTFFTATVAAGLLVSYPALVGGMFLGMLLMPKFFLVMLEHLAEVNQALRQQRNQAEHMATHDALTGLPNRVLLEGILAQAIAKAKRAGTTGAVVFLDLDGFKVINDNYGHEYGDLLLQEIGRCLRQRLRTSDTVARLGGDEFILLIEDGKGAGAVAAVVEQMFGCFRRSLQIGPYQAYVTSSCGVAIFPQDGEDPQTLIKHADTAMYRAKEAGRNRFCLYDAQMSAVVAAQLTIRDELRHAIDAGELRVYYQPLVEMPSRRIIGAEALVRWQHPRRGLLGPAEFIAVAEQSGLIVAIGDQVLDRAVQEASAWSGLEDAAFRLHVNISAHQLMHADFPARVMATLRRHGLPAAALELEMTESVLIDDAVEASGLFETLHGHGIGISLDDFGTGYSSLSYLKRLPVDHIKLDRSFVQDVPGDPDDCALLEATFIFGRRLGIEVIAEGVETEAQLAWLSEQGCRCMQGYYFGRPVPAAEFGAALRAQVRSASQAAADSR